MNQKLKEMLIYWTVTMLGFSFFNSFVGMNLVGAALGATTPSETVLFFFLISPVTLGWAIGFVVICAIYLLDKLLKKVLKIDLRYLRRIG